MDIATITKACQHANGSGFNPVLNALHIYATEQGTRAQAGNGRYVLDYPTDLPPMTTPASRLLTALKACKADPKLELDGPNLVVKSGRMKVKLPLLESSTYPVTVPDPGTTALQVPVGALLKRIVDYVATDASRPWATSVCLRNGFAYATNNVILCRMPFPFPFPHAINLPRAAVEAVIENPEPTALGFTENSITFYYADGLWLKTQLVAGDWPTEVVDKMLDGVEDRTDWVSIDEDLGRHLDVAEKLADARHPVVSLFGQNVTLEDDTFTVDGVTGLPERLAKLNASMASLALSGADVVVWHHPRPDAHTWQAPGGLVGVLGGVR